MLEQAIVKRAGSRDFFGTAYGQHKGKFDGLKFGDANVQLDDTLLLIEPEAAKGYEAAIPPVVPPGPTPPGPTPAGPTSTPKPRAFHGNVTINAATAKMHLVEVAEEIIAVLAADPNADVKVTLKIEVAFPSGVSDQTTCAVTENAKTLSFRNADWE